NSSPIVRMGPFEEGDEVEIRLTIPPTGDHGRYTGSNEYMMVRKNAGFNFYYLDEEAFKEDIAKLRDNSWNLDMSQTNDRYLVGDVDASDGEILMTSIPYEPGWEVKIDGKTVQSQILEEKNEETGKVTLRNDSGAEGAVIVLGTLMGIRVPAGHHTVSMKYTPPGFNIGVLTLILGIILLVLFYMYDRKHNKVIADKKKTKELIKSGEADKIAKEAEKVNDTTKKKVEIIKSKGAVAEEPLKKAKDSSEEAEEEAEELVSEAIDKAEDAVDKAADIAEDIKKKAEEAAETVVESTESAVESVLEEAKKKKK
ncbi:MAG: YfhO family protein, partial [Ruminococcus sp.]|uniref:YfhO family protein n=1 Tax=Ruminococcus sp. TaxID=41978 RepID=UPI001B1AFD56